MSNLRTLAASCVLALALTACGEHAAPLAPEGARFDSGYTYGSGNVAGDSGFGFGSGNATDDAGHGFGSGNVTTSTDSTVTLRGGHTFGSGN